MTDAPLGTGMADRSRASQWRPARQDLLPGTFEERGAVLPFTTPRLAQARVRKDYRNQLELVIGQFAGTAGSYVVPWAGMAELFTLTSHDAMLHEAVLDKRAFDPHSVRRCALEVALTGLAGPDAAEAAERALAEDEQQRVSTEVVIILKVIEQAEQSATRELMRDVATEEGQMRVRRALLAVVNRLGIDPAEFDRRVSKLSAISYPVGVSWNPEVGRLRHLLARLQSFRASIGEWSNNRRGDLAEQSAYCGEVAEHTLKIALDLIGSFNAAIGNPVSVLRDWRNQAPLIERSTQRLSWLLDGWSTITEFWFDATDDLERVMTLAQITPILPLIPRNQLVSEAEQLLSDRIVIRAPRWVRANENWRTGQLDHEMTRRLEALRAKTP